LQGEKENARKEHRDACITNVPECRYCVMLFNVHEKRTLAASSAQADFHNEEKLKEERM